MSRRSATAAGSRVSPAHVPVPAPPEAAPASTLTFEVQFYRDKRWRIDSIFDDCSLAVFVAKQMNDSGRYLCVRVVQEHFDPATQHTKLATLYRGGRIEQAHKKDIEERIKARDEAREAAEAEGGDEPEPAAPARRRSGSQRWLKLALAGVSALALALGWCVVMLLAR